jgi:hypothetical protein
MPTSKLLFDPLGLSPESPSCDIAPGPIAIMFTSPKPTRKRLFDPLPLDLSPESAGSGDIAPGPIAPVGCGAPGTYAPEELQCAAAAPKHPLPSQQIHQMAGTPDDILQGMRSLRAQPSEPSAPPYTPSKLPKFPGTTPADPDDADLGSAEKKTCTRKYSNQPIEGFGDVKKPLGCDDDH